MIMFGICCAAGHFVATLQELGVAEAIINEAAGVGYGMLKTHACLHDNHAEHRGQLPQALPQLHYRDLMDVL